MSVDYEEKMNKGWVVSDRHPNILLKYRVLPDGTDTDLYIEIKFCNDCRGLYPEPYMVEDDVWKFVVTEKKCFLCLPCLEKRLLRKLHRHDFTDADINKNLLFGYNMGKNEVSG